MGGNITLSPRLYAAVSFVRKDAVVADVGTDHGFAAAYLVQTEKASRVIASDVREGPLASAKRTAAEYGLSERIDFRLTDGLSGMKNDGLDTVIIAGMGGETMISILSADMWSLCDGMTLILQPQSKHAELSDFLAEHGFFPNDARIVRDAGRLYIVYTACMCGETERTEAEKLVPRVLFERQDPLLPEYLDTLLNKLSRALSGMEKSENNETSAKTKSLIAELLDMKKETEKWQR